MFHTATQTEEPQVRQSQQVLHAKGRLVAFIHGGRLLFRSSVVLRWVLPILFYM